MHENIYMFLRQDGFFATRDSVAESGISRLSRDWVGGLRESGLLTKYRVLRNQIFEFLNVSSFAEISRLLEKDQGLSRELNLRGFLLLGNMFGIKGTDKEIVAAVKNYSGTADNVIRYLKSSVLANYAPYIEITNEIDIRSSPVELLLINFDDRYHKKARFEAKRKLILMILAGSINQREREMDVERKFSGFLDFLNSYVWSSGVKIGELEHVFLKSRHAGEDFSCLEVRVLSGLESSRVLAEDEKLTLIKRRHFTCEGKKIPIYVSIRKKPPEAKVLKLIRKREENPAVAVDDELGLMAVLDSEQDIRIFQKHLTRSAAQAHSFMVLEEVSDTLDGTYHHSSSSIGSSDKTPMLKFFARMGGMRVEFIVHTNKSYLDYIYKRDVSHDEYEIKRIIDSGAAGLLFPADIYRLDMQGVRQEQLLRCRRKIEKNGAAVFR